MNDLTKKYKPPVKACNNGNYWVNVPISETKGKCVMAEIIDYEVGMLRLWSNSCLMACLPGWEASIKKEGWHFKNVLPEEVTFHNFP